MRDRKAVFTALKPDYSGLAEVLTAFAKLYETCDNTKLLDNSLEDILYPWKTPEILKHIGNESK